MPACLVMAASNNLLPLCYVNIMKLFYQAIRSASHLFVILLIRREGLKFVTRQSLTPLSRFIPSSLMLLFFMLLLTILHLPSTSPIFCPCHHPILLLSTIPPIPISILTHCTKHHTHIPHTSRLCLPTTQTENVYCQYPLYRQNVGHTSQA